MSDENDKGDNKYTAAVKLGAACPHCRKQPGEVNHPRGMVFVGWGLGWQTCLDCDGTGIKTARQDDRA